MHVLLTSKEWRQLLSPSTSRIVALAPGPSSCGWRSSSCGCGEVMSVNVNRSKSVRRECVSKKSVIIENQK